MERLLSRKKWKAYKKDRWGGELILSKVMDKKIAYPVCVVKGRLKSINDNDKGGVELLQHTPLI